MKLSIIIVNYNVRYFLEQCLYSVRLACQDPEAEVFVVDNNSVDGSADMVKKKFPEVRLIENQENLGFSKANNLAIQASSGDYILLLNPDTVVEKDTFTKTVSFMEEHPEAGALGVKMIDGKGRFLPESKRGLPTPLVAFYKIFGFSALFPRSRVFGRYHLGFLHEDQVHQVDILSGAFMMLRKEALEKTGLLDETFFMYGEDIDLSYRLIKAGYKNYYFPLTRIIHYKGESTKKSSVNYVFTFYRAMVIFARKHFSQQNARIFSFLIHLAIYLRAFIAVSFRFFQRAILPVADAILLFAGIYLIKGWWENILFPWGGHYPSEFISVAVPVYILVWLFSIFLSGGYDRPVKLLKIIQGFALGTLVILVLYSLLSENYRFSRAMIFFGLLWGLFSTITLRLLLHYVFKSRIFRIGNHSNKRFIVIGDQEEAERVASLVRNTFLNPGFIGLVSPSGSKPADDRYIGNIRQIHEIIEIYGIEEVIFCAKDIPSAKIIDLMSEQQNLPVEFKIAPPESLSIIGSKNINTAEDLFIINIDSVVKRENQRVKHFFDLIVSLSLLILSPLLIFIVSQPGGLFANIFKVIIRKRSWVGYCDDDGIGLEKLPKIKKGILSPMDVLPSKTLDRGTIHRLNLLYARDYQISTDLNIVMKGIRKTGRNN
ncbi:MAG: glycosyltransferase [Bacteroidetes bacterium]|nr:glycosyltransferase [Bacteroidota bacterium]